MLKKRIIPCLDIKNRRVVKGVNFENLRDAGDALALAQRYSEEGADELVFLDISATEEARKTVSDFAHEVAKRISIPFTVGGGIASLEAAREILRAGADKIAINSSAVNNPKLISEISAEFGAQALVLAIDAKKVGDKKWEVFTRGGKTPTGKEVVKWAREGEKLGAGEILLTSMDRDGTQIGFDTELTKAVSEAVSLPVVASGGAKTAEHFVGVFQQTRASGGLAASVFHFGELDISVLKHFLHERNIPVRLSFSEKNES